MTEDWRLQGQERFLLGVTLSRMNYKKYRPDWEHDHCELCSKKFSEEPGDTNGGYVTTDGYHWICDECFADFKERFKWEVVEKTEDGG